MIPTPFSLGFFLLVITNACSTRLVYFSAKQHRCLIVECHNPADRLIICISIQNDNIYFSGIEYWHPKLVGLLLGLA